MRVVPAQKVSSARDGERGINQLFYALNLRSLTWEKAFVRPRIAWSSLIVTLQLPLQIRSHHHCPCIPYICKQLIVQTA